jgi:hypothetical protein
MLVSHFSLYQLCRVVYLCADDQIASGPPKLFDRLSHNGLRLTIGIAASVKERFSILDGQGKGDYLSAVSKKLIPQS